MLSSLANTRPLVAGWLADTVLRVERASPPRIAIRFANRGQLALAQTNRAFKESVREILAGALESPVVFQLEFELDESMNQSDAPPPSEPARRNAGPPDEESLVRKEPIVGRILEVFQGVWVDPGEEAIP